MKILISNDPNKLSAVLERFSTYATVEAEYGDTLVEGSSPLLTLAHHGSRSESEPPCVGDDFPLEEVTGLEAIGLSHFDLDTLGGVMRLLRRKDKTGRLLASKDIFWVMAGIVDVRGPHRLQDICQALEATVRETGHIVSLWPPEYGTEEPTRVNVTGMLHAFWAWSENNRIYVPNDGTVLDITKYVLGAMEVIERILHGDPELLRVGQRWAEGQDELERTSFVGRIRSVVLRQSERFVNHLYGHQGSTVYDAVVAHNPERGTVTLSLAQSCGDIDCGLIAQELWGKEAGGHAGIAGSPRNVVMGFEEAARAAAVLADKLRNLG